MANKGFFIDQMGFEVGVPQTPIKVVSLVPSQTELIFYLGGQDKLVGITKFCIHPQPEVKKIAKIGGTKNFHFEKIKALSPDLIIGNKEENYHEGISVLKHDFPVWMSDIYNLGDALTMIVEVSKLLNVSAEGHQLANEINKKFGQLSIKNPKTALYFIWQNPLMIAGKNTFIDDMLNRAGFINLANDERYPSLNEEQIKALDPEVILLSSEPFPFSERHLNYFQQLCPSAKVVTVDGELFSWYGSRLLKSPDYFHQLNLQLNPTVL